MTNSSTFPQSAEGMPGQFFEPDTLQHVCSKCSAAIITDKNTAVARCAFCGSDKFYAARLDDARKPDSVIPFKYGRAEAIEAFFKWCKGGRFSPIGFVKDSNVEKLTGLYVPFCLYDCDTDMDFTANASTVSYITTGGRKNNHTTKTSSFYELIRKRKLHWENIPVNDLSRIDETIIESIEPYDFSEIERFDMKHLAGCYAAKSDLPPELLEKKMKEKFNKHLAIYFQSLIDKYTFVTNVADKSVHQKTESHNVLLPLWILNYKYWGKTYTFAMNGQTGRTAGNPPVSILKLILLGLILLPVIVTICGIIGGLIMGGFVG